MRLPHVFMCRVADPLVLLPCVLQVVSVTMPLSQQAGYYCNVCDCILRDSQSYLDHINGGCAQGLDLPVELPSSCGHFIQSDANVPWPCLQASGTTVRWA
jgi:hypothetical protein